MSSGAHQELLGANLGGTVTQFQVVKITTAVAGKLTVIASAATTDICFGVAQQGGSAGDHVEICVHGETYVHAGGTVAAGSLVNGDAAGLADNQSTTVLSLPVIGLMLESAVVTDFAKMWVIGSGTVEANAS